MADQHTPPADDRFDELKAADREVRRQAAIIATVLERLTRRINNDIGQFDRAPKSTRSEFAGDILHEINTAVFNLPTIGFIRAASAADAEAAVRAAADGTRP